MKRMIIYACCTGCFLMAALQSGAQQNKKAAAQIATDSEQKQAVQTPATDQKETAKPVTLPFKKADGPQPAAVQQPADDKQGKEEMKGKEITEAAQKAKPAQSADRPKTSTIEPDKREMPQARQAAKIAVQQQ